MQIEAYICPQCGATLNVNENTTFCTCQSCGSKIRITYSDNKNQPQTNNKKQFTSPEGVVIGTALIGDDYEAEGSYEALWHSETVPQYYALCATRNDHTITMKAYSKELFHEIKNPFLKGMIRLVDVHAKEGYQKFEEPEAYLIKEAESYAGQKLKLTSSSKLPSPLGRNPQLARKLLRSDIDVFGSFVEIPPTIVSEYTDSLLYRFEGELNGKPLVIFAGMDYEGAELAYTKPVFSGLISKIKGTSDKDRFGHSKKHVDQIMFGSQWMYKCICFADKEEVALKDFMRFINSIDPDPSLGQREINLFAKKNAAIQDQIARNQAIARANMAALQANQQRLAQTLKENSDAMHNMIMDSWNKKMDSDSRISQNWSEATRGVNTYTNSYGQNVEVSVVADHVYQNQYGDVYGVSGNEVDQEILNKLNWTKLNR